MTKVCTKCKQEKDIKEFYEHSTTKDGYQPWCKICLDLNSKKSRLNKRLESITMQYEELCNERDDVIQKLKQVNREIEESLKPKPPVVKPKVYPNEVYIPNKLVAVKTVTGRIVLLDETTGLEWIVVDSQLKRHGS